MDEQQRKIAVTGASGYSGKYIAKQLMEQGVEVISLTNSPNKPNPLQLSTYPLSWHDEGLLARHLIGCDALVNTYWVRFNHANFSHEQAVEHTKALFRAAKTAGVKRIVHVSITNPDASSSLSYFKGKAELEENLKQTGIPYSILRPAVLFGGEQGEDILLNNMAWALRHFPFVGVFGNGEYKMQPIHVQDFAALACREALRTDGGSGTIEAIGPETFTFKGLFQALGNAIQCRRPVIGVPVWFGYLAVKMMGAIQGDVMLTRDEVTGLMENTLFVPGAPPAGETKLTEWIAKHADTLGRNYASELSRRK